MRKKTGMLLLALLCALYVPAMASVEDIPIDLLALFEAQNYGDPATDYMEFTTPDGVRHAFILVDGGMDGYQYRDGSWKMYSSGWFDAGMGMRFQRHDVQTPRADGSFYPDDLGFDLLGNIDGFCESYHYNGEYFALCGWIDTSSYSGAVIVDGTTISYYPLGDMEAEYTVDVGDEMTLKNWISVFRDYPASPGEAKKRAMLLKSEMADDFPGYTLLNYVGFNSGKEAKAGYYRLRDGLLDIKRVAYTADGGCVSEEDAMPIPITDSLIEKMEAGLAETLITTDWGDTFKTDDGLDRIAIPVQGNILNLDVQSQGMILLTEEENQERRLYWVTMDQTASYNVQTIGMLPENARLDLAHARNGKIIIQWDGGNRMAGCTLGADGSWNLEWMMNSGMDGIVDYRLLYCGVMVGDRVRVGTLEGTDLTEGKLSSLPKTEQEMMAALDRSGWAVVDNPNPADRLHLRASPQKSAASLGKFYNGTPVQVLENLGEWCHVRIGLDGNLEGYMMTRYLAFGVQMDEVGTAFPEMVFLEEQVRRVLYADMRLTQEAGTVDTGYYWIVGVVDNSLYIVLTENGMIGYAPQDWFWAGNG